MSARLLLVVVLAFASRPVAAVELERYTADVAGSLTVDTDGRVVDVDLVDESGLGDTTIAGVEDLVRSWRFEPIVEDGRPVNARGLMRLSLVAEREPNSERMTLGVREAWFVDDVETDARKAAGPGGKVTRPLYPRRALHHGVGAELMLLVELAADGAVERVETERLLLLGPPPGPLTSQLVREFVRAAEHTAEGWRLPAFADSTVRVPVRFTLWRDGWVRLHERAWTPDPWVLLKLAEPVAIESLSADGETSRFRMLETPPDAGAADGG